MLREKDIARLIERFLDGTTTATEERQLYRYFASSRVAPQWEAYREMFQDYAALDAEQGLAAPNRTGRRLRLWHVVAGVAAVGLLLFGTVTLLRIQETRMLQRHYGGSYVIENGRRIDDLRVIAPNVRSTLVYAASVEQQVETDAERMRQTERDVLDNISDPQMRQSVMKILNE